MKLGIGEFSLVTSMWLKASRLYRERGLLVPAETDPSSGYRYYDEANLERARSIQVLKRYDFSLAEIKELLDTILIAGHRMQGGCEEIGKGLGIVCKKMGRYAVGKPMALYYDAEYKEEGADFEPCIPVRKRKEVEGISIRELKGGRFVSLIHKGPCDTLTGRSSTT